MDDVAAARLSQQKRSAISFDAATSARDRPDKSARGIPDGGTVTWWSVGALQSRSGARSDLSPYYLRLYSVRGSAIRSDGARDHAKCCVVKAAVKRSIGT